MILTLLKAKLHQACVIYSEPDYEGSCAIDHALLKATNIHEYEQVHIYNLTNGERFTTYIITAQENSGIISVNGAAAHKASPNDRLIICAYAQLEEQAVKQFQPTLIYLNQDNQIIRRGHKIPTQVA